MATVAKSFIHNRDKLVGESGDADGVLPEDIQDYIAATNVSNAVTSSLNITMCEIDGNRVLTLVVIGDDS